ncbi:hypothetical protein MAPG_09980 [Magnaporthiopsis poae ATCC 64411]|uniref:Uncharacterized protein n=1 Tax=Magnaporthiopsis poae (strain ATCC 64411 / 73-15) TaxID=644358 RepID=A0A0C4EBD2_MAGP6|nr:hypothetical protein MAPG_09980 [Magnaporthiopsis poae ATCC 64411]
MKATACLRTVGSAGSLQGAGKRLFSSQQRAWPSSHDLPAKRPPGEDAETDRFISEMGRMELRPRIDAESKTIATPSGALPISPLMDERRLKAQRERRLPKPAPDRLRNGTFERRLENNPYATALGTPIRMDTATNTLLPRFFLQDFYFINHPETDAPWFAPTSLFEASEQPTEELAASEQPADDHNVSEQSTREHDASEGPTEEHNAGEQRAEEHNANERPTKEHDASEQPTRNYDSIHEATAAPDVIPSPSGNYLARRISILHCGAIEEPRPATAGAYAMCRRDLFAALAGGVGVPTDLRQYRNRHVKMANFARQTRAVWRADMDELVCGLMRARVLKSLQYLATFCEDPFEPRDYIVRCKAERLEEEDWGKHEFRGCVLWLGGSVGDPASNQPPPKEFEVVTASGVRRNTALPVHDLNRLLGPEAVQTLRTESEVFKQGVFFMLARPRTKQLQMWLWKLQGYLAEYPDYR